MRAPSIYTRIFSASLSRRARGRGAALQCGISRGGGRFYIKTGTCPDPSTLIGPIRPTHRHITILPSVRLIRDAFAVRVRLGDPRVVPSFHCPFLPDMPPSMSPGRSESCFFQSTDSDMGLRQDLNGSALPTILPSASSRARISGLIDSPLLRPVRLLAPLDGSDRVLSRPRELLHPGFQRVSHLSHCWTLLRQSLDSSVGGTSTHWNVS